MNRRILFPLPILGMCLGVSSCAAKPAPSLRIVNPGPMFVLVEQSSWLRCYTENLEGKIQFEVENPEYVEVTPRGCCVGLKCGSTKVTAFVGEVSDSIEVHVLDPKVEPQSFGFYPKNGIYEGHVGDRLEFKPYVYDVPYFYLREYIVPILLTDPSIAHFEGNILVAEKPGEVWYCSQLLNWVSQPLCFTILNDQS